MSGCYKIHGVLLLALVSSMVMLGCSGEKPAAEKEGGKAECGGAACVVTFNVLSNDPLKYDGRRVSLDGYVAIENGLLSIFPNQDSYEHEAIGLNVIVLRAPVEIQKGIFDNFGYKYVHLFGVFHIKKNGSDPFYVIGSMDGDLKVYENRNRSRPEDREGWGDVKIYLDDLHERKSSVPRAGDGG